MIDIIYIISNLIKNKKYNSAIECIEKSLCESKEIIDLLQLKAYVYTKLNDYYTAESIYLNILDIDYENEIAIDKLFHFYCTAEKIDEAFNIKSKLNDNETVITLLNIARNYYNLYLFDDALKYSKKLEFLSPNTPSNLILLSDIYLKFNDFNKYEYYLNKAYQQ